PLAERAPSPPAAVRSRGGCVRATVSPMVKACRGLVRTAAILLLCTVAATGARTASAHPSGTLDWQARRNRVDARIQSWSLASLAASGSARGWPVSVEPGPGSGVTARLEGLSQGAALRPRPGRLTSAPLPQADGPAKLFVFRTSAEGATERVRAAATGGSPGR